MARVLKVIGNLILALLNATLILVALWLGKIAYDRALIARHEHAATTEQLRFGIFVEGEPGRSAKVRIDDVEFIYKERG